MRPASGRFLATSDVAPAFLSWVVSRATAVSISGSPFSGDMGSVLVNPAATTTYTLTNTGGPSGSATATVIVGRGFGISTDTPLRGDFDGDGRNDLAIYRGSTGQWFVSGSAGSLSINQTWGAPSLGDVPVPADYDGDGRDDVAVFRTANGHWFIQQSSGGFLMVSWGAPSFGDTPVPADYDGDGKADLAVYRRSTGQWLIFLSVGGNFVATLGCSLRGRRPGAGRLQRRRQDRHRRLSQHDRAVVRRGVEWNLLPDQLGRAGVRRHARHRPTTTATAAPTWPSSASRPATGSSFARAAGRRSRGGASATRGSPATTSAAPPPRSPSGGPRPGRG